MKRTAEKYIFFFFNALCILNSLLNSLVLWDAKCTGNSNWHLASKSLKEEVQQTRK